MSSSIDDFIHISTGPEPPVPSSSSKHGVSGAFFGSTHGDRWFTEGIIVQSIRSKYPKHHLTVNPGYACDLLAFANSREDAVYLSRSNDRDGLLERQFIPPRRRYNDEKGGSMGERVLLGCFDYVFQENAFVLYIVEGSDGMMGKTRYNYILVPPKAEGEEMSIEEKTSAQKKTDELLAAGSRWMQELHNEVLVFDQGWWQKNRELWENVQESNWEDVILEKEKKEAIIDDVIGFFDSETRYAEFGVPWKARLPPSSDSSTKLTLFNREE
ncbi:hypothetical protein G7Y89_g9690 [Cudoniella acicularis]|uniref:Uncharacterized protein n=1 Tax=Cudoniella acicularis TaxID=354080 RepID=A0A8H4RGU8_9HELO|nr:hypothetical protein G7Y89_g9690 [Cudoniella acicularis]